MSDKKKLVIVESPAKARTISQYLGDQYEVLASVGHIRDLVEPKNLPADLKKGSMGKFSVDIENNFSPYYEVSPAKKKTVAELKRALTGADELYLATDEDREGEAIAWHLLEVLRPKVPVHRMVFHEITKESIERAKENTRELDTDLVDAQETRRILDRLYGYEVSPVLWRKVGPGLSAGRVQSAATRLIVDRERERRAHISANYWDIKVELTPENQKRSFFADLATLNGKKLATGADFNDRGELKPKSAEHVVLSQELAEALAQQFERPETQYAVSKIVAKPYTRRPSAPFTTSTLQQEAGRKLRFSARQTMSVAQSLYENGYITYMRTDSNSLSSQAVSAARAQAAQLFGKETVPDKPRVYAGKSKNAQEAHEAIRPSGEVFRTPSELKSVLHGNDFKLYELIWKRTIASQMADAKGSTTSVTVEANNAAEQLQAELQASGTIVTFQGFLLAYEESTDDNEDTEKAEDAEVRLPQLEEGNTLTQGEIVAAGHQTNPPARYTEASLVKVLEEKGIGRPSTYASIISVILDRGYVTKRGQALVPSWTAFAVVKLLEEHFSDLVEYDFTAEMEADLDKIADGSEDRVAWLNGFYFGHDQQPGLKGVIDNLGEIDARAINSIPLNESITLRVGRYGPYLEVAQPEGEDPQRVGVPEELAPDELTIEKANELIAIGEKGDIELGVNPENGKMVVAKDGRYGPYVTEIEPEPESEEPAENATEAEDAPKKKPKKKAPAVKPRTASLFKSMDLNSIDLETALRLLNLPRVVGIDPESSEEITAQNGRFGPYLKKGSDSRTLSSEEQIFNITLEEALEIYKQPKYGGRSASAPLREFDNDPESGKPIKIKDGRFGPYITDGTTNVTVPKGDTIEDMTFERAVELLAIKRAKGPVKRATRKAPAKKAPAKKPAAKKPAAKKPAAKKPDSSS